ncbi:hypothetical protein KCP71_08685 [Salmonella enterica subsp. enterica]|nr:hypothetical protein KCP71_08685 [Salmonella enterica subsp. enterica]
MESGSRRLRHSSPLPEPAVCFVFMKKDCTAASSPPQHDVARHVDLLVGVVPIVNLEWIRN